MLHCTATLRKSTQLPLKRINTPMTTRSALALIAFIALCQATGLLGVMSGETGNSAWYQALSKPSFNPPPWVFAPAWIALYTLMAIAAWRVWRLGPKAPGAPAALGLREPGWALLVITALLILILATWRAFARLDVWAGRLMVPYIAWVAFACVLNAAIWWLN